METSGDSICLNYLMQVEESKGRRLGTARQLLLFYESLELYEYDPFLPRSKKEKYTFLSSVNISQGKKWLKVDCAALLKCALKFLNSL